MPIPAPGNVDAASQATLLAVKAKVDPLPAAPAQQGTLTALENIPAWINLLQWEGLVVQGTWTWQADVNVGYFRTIRAEAAGYWRNSTLGVNDEYKYPNMWLTKGTWELELYVVKRSDAGILEVLHGAASWGISDLYSAGLLYDTRLVFSGNLAADTLADFRFRSTTKNVASTGYHIPLQRMTLKKIG